MNMTTKTLLACIAGILVGFTLLGGLAYSVAPPRPPLGDFTGQYPIRFRVERPSYSRADITCPLLHTIRDTMTDKVYLVVDGKAVIEVKPE